MTISLSRRWLARVAMALLSAIVVDGHLEIARLVRAQADRLQRGQMDVVSARTRMLEPLMPYLPDRGRIGYIKPGFSWAVPTDMAEFFVSEYVLAPRVLVYGTVDDLVLTVPGSGTQEGALRDFVLIHQSDGGVKLFRRAR